ncbi:MAG: twin-arginine translocase TatA/TatE family subunit [bacterium]
MLPFGIGFSEVLLILVVLLLVVGPQKLPEIARTLGKGVRAARRAGQELRDAVQIDEIRRNVYDHTVRPWQQATDIEDAVVEPRRSAAKATATAAAAAQPAPAHAAHTPHTAPDDEAHDPDEGAPSGPIGRGPGPVLPAAPPARPDAPEPEPTHRPPHDA